MTDGQQYFVYPYYFFVFFPLREVTPRGTKAPRPARPRIGPEAPARSTSRAARRCNQAAAPHHLLQFDSTR